MPLGTLTVRRGKSAELKSAVLDAVQRALVGSGVPRKTAFTASSDLALGGGRLIHS